MPKGQAYRRVLPVIVWMIGWSVLSPAQAGERVTDGQLQEMFGRSHSVMKAQRERLHGLLDGFLMGDAVAIERYADEIGTDMADVGREFPPDPGQQAEIWKTMSELVEASRQLRTNAHEGNHQEAYQQLAVMVSRCILCHQQRRTWGKFLEPEATPGGDEGAPASTGGSSDDVQTSVEYK